MKIIIHEHIGYLFPNALIKDHLNIHQRLPKHLSTRTFMIYLLLIIVIWKDKTPLRHYLSTSHVNLFFFLFQHKYIFIRWMIQSKLFGK